MEYRPAICGICPYGCAVLAACKDGKIVDVKTDHHTARGHICPRGKAAPAIVHADNRLTTPLIRNGPKGHMSFRSADWEEALDYTAAKLTACQDNYGSNSLASYLGGGSLEDSLVDFAGDYFAHMGSANDLSSGSICYVSSRILAPLTTLGLPWRYVRPDFACSDVIFIWGTNPYTDSGRGSFADMRKAQKRGARLVVIDPRQSETAAIADLWLPVLPGTDGALILALLKTVLAENRYDHQFVQYTVGMEQLDAYLAGLSLQELLNYCGVSAAMHRTLVDWFCSSSAVSLSFYTGMEYQPSAVQCVRALLILWSLGGKLDVRGGLRIEGGPFETVNEYKYPPDARPVGAAEYPLFTALCGKGQFVEFPQAVLNNEPYPVRSLLLLGASPILSYPDAKLWEKTYLALEFMAVIDIFMPEEGRFADVIFPSTTYYENFSYCCYQDGIRLRKQVIPPVGEARNGLYILQALAQRLGFGYALPKDDAELLDFAFGKNPHQMYELQHNCYGVNNPPEIPRYKKYASGRLRADGQPGFPTISGKFEIASPLLPKYGYEAVPRYTHPYTEDREKFPFCLTTGARSLYRYNSFGPNITALSHKETQATLDMNHLDAKKLNLKEGDRAIIRTQWGELALPVRIYPIGEGIVHIPYGGGSRLQIEGWQDANVNQLCSLKVRDEISGYIVCKALQCNIEKQRGINL